MDAMKEVNPSMKLKPIRVKTKDFDCWVSHGVAIAAGLSGDPQEIATQVVAISACFDPSQKIYKKDSRSEVREVYKYEKKWVVKHLKMQGLKGLIYRAVKLTPPWREWRGCLSLAQTGCDVVAPLGVVFSRDGKRSGVGDMVLPHINGGALYEWLLANKFNKNTKVQRRTIARRMGIQTGIMTKGGLINRDIKPSNWVIRYDHHNPIGYPMMIDLAGMRKNSGEKKVIKMLRVLFQGLEEVGGVTVQEGICFLQGFLSEDIAFMQGQKNRLNAILIAISQ